MKTNQHKKCPICNIEFPANKTSKTCSKICGKKQFTLTRRKHSECPCPICGTLFYSRKGTKKTCSRKCSLRYTSNKAEQNKINWRHNHDGYLVADIVRGGIRIHLLQHRHLIEEHIGRKLQSDEVVHHKNGVRDDNRIENLEIQNRSEHASEHGRKRKGFGGWKQNLTPKQRKIISDRMKKNKVWEYSEKYKKRRQKDANESN